MVDELRRGYHDRLGDLRDQSIAVVEDAAASVGNVTAALLAADPESAAAVVATADDVTRRVVAVEGEVLDLLAQQAPVARDLRIILAALRIAQIAALCAGLCRTLAAYASRGDDILTASLGQHIADMGAATSALLQLSAQAWRVIDVGVADKVETEAVPCRSLHRRFLRALFELDPVAIEIAVELGMAARAYERFTDHAVEIAGRVCFAATGASRPRASEADEQEP